MASAETWPVPGSGKASAANTTTVPWTPISFRKTICGWQRHRELPSAGQACGDDGL